MVKPEQVLYIEPENELRFKGPFSEEPVTSHILLTNPTNHKVYFKIKTTAPKRYCVRPNGGMILPRKKSQISVTLQPFDFDPAEKNKHKFMVQSLICPSGMDDNRDAYDTVWKDPSADQVMESKIKCVFENPVMSTSETITSTETSTNAENKAIRDPELKLTLATQEVNQLRTQESALRQENIQLKEDILILRNAALGKDNTLPVTKDLISQNHSQFPPNTFLIAILMGIIGYIFGKMF
ncbi:VAMP-associated protein 33kDa isoform X2 [Augochlora pura]